MKTKKGFTIIEVVLVLAIAGLIFMAVFIVLPPLWASQRDAARKENLMTFVTNLANYQTNNNRGALPGAETSIAMGVAVACEPNTSLKGVSLEASVSDESKVGKGLAVSVDGDCVVADRETDEAYRQIKSQSWAGFYRDFMTDSFEDPDGQRYDLYVASCDTTSASLKAGEKCNNGEFKNLWGENNLNRGGRKDDWLDYTIYVAVGATCDGDTAVKALNNRKVAVVYKMERTGQFCYNS